MGWATRKLEKRFQTVSTRIERLLARGRYDEALASLYEALDVLGEMAQADPADAKPLVARVAVLHKISYLLQGSDDVGRVMRIVDERLLVCRDLTDRFGLDTRGEVAEMEVQRGALWAMRGRGASAVVHLDRGLGAYLALLDEPEAEPVEGLGLAAEFSSALIYQAVTLMEYGDPTLAGAAADNAFRFYVGQYDQPRWNAALMAEIATTASGILARVGRLDDAVAADECVVIGARDAARASGSAADRTKLASALAVWGLHLSASGADGSLERSAECLAEGRRLDPAATAAEIEGWDRLQSQARPLTLSAALRVAAERTNGDRVLAGLPECLTGAPDPRTFRISRLCEPERIPQYAVRLAAVSVDLLPTAVREGVRIGLEAHYLFAVGWDRTPVGRDQLREWGVPWARLTLECCRALGTEPDQPSRLALALDLATSNLERVDALLLLVGDDHAPDGSAQAPDRVEVAQLLHDCLTQHAELFDTHGDQQVAQTLRGKAATLSNRLR